MRDFKGHWDVLADTFGPGIGRVAREPTLGHDRGPWRSSQSKQQREVQVDTQRHEYLKVPEVAEVLRIARSRAYELVGNGEIPSVRIGRSVRVSRRELEKWLEEQRQPRAGWK
jgi:excisionase family DNA binding protein